MKLNYKKTLLVGFAFFLISTFWQAYDTIIPKILTDEFGLSQSISGILMAVDNILALFLLPLFGAFSDKLKTRFGKRTPFIFVGTIVACTALMCLSFADNMQLANIEKISAMDEAALMELYDADLEITRPENTESERLRDAISREEFIKITQDSPQYAELVVPARQVYAWQRTTGNPAALACFVGILLILLVAMGTFRSPAVALMPDVTPKPLRSKANAIINLMGSFGGISVLVLGMVFGTGKVANSLMSYTAFFGVVAGIMIAALVIFCIFVREPKWSAEMLEVSAAYGVDDKAENDGSGDRKLSRGELVSLILILASVVLWFMGYNAVSSKYSVYATEVLGLDYNATLIIAQAAAIVSYVPVGVIASKVGRKKCILAGVIMLSTAFGVASFMRMGSSPVVMNCLFALAGIGWATINVNSYPMVVELSRGSNVGKYTGFYYTASMSAQVITPILSGIFMDIKITSLFPYATVFVVCALFTMFFVKHGDSKPRAKGLEALEAMDD